jgi:hypothetical protein
MNTYWSQWESHRRARTNERTDIRVAGSARSPTNNNSSAIDELASAPPPPHCKQMQRRQRTASAGPQHSSTVTAATVTTIRKSKKKIRNHRQEIPDATATATIVVWRRSISPATLVTHKSPPGFGVLFQAPSARALKCQSVSARRQRTSARGHRPSLRSVPPPNSPAASPLYSDCRD